MRVVSCSLLFYAPGAGQCGVPNPYDERGLRACRVVCAGWWRLQLGRRQVEHFVRVVEPDAELPVAPPHVDPDQPAVLRLDEGDDVRVEERAAVSHQALDLVADGPVVEEVVVLEFLVILKLQ